MASSNSPATKYKRGENGDRVPGGGGGAVAKNLGTKERCRQVGNKVSRAAANNDDTAFQEIEEEMRQLKNPYPGQTRKSYVLKSDFKTILERRGFHEYQKSHGKFKSQFEDTWKPGQFHLNGKNFRAWIIDEAPYEAPAVAQPQLPAAAGAAAPGAPRPTSGPQQQPMSSMSPDQQLGASPVAGCGVLPMPAVYPKTGASPVYGTQASSGGLGPAAAQQQQQQGIQPGPVPGMQQQQPVRAPDPPTSALYYETSMCQRVTVSAVLVVFGLACLQALAHSWGLLPGELALCQLAPLAQWVHQENTKPEALLGQSGYQWMTLGNLLLLLAILAIFFYYLAGHTPTKYRDELQALCPSTSTDHGGLTGAQIQHRIDCRELLILVRQYNRETPPVRQAAVLSVLVTLTLGACAYYLFETCITFIDSVTSFYGLPAISAIVFSVVFPSLASLVVQIVGCIGAVFCTYVVWTLTQWVISNVRVWWKLDDLVADKNQEILKLLTQTTATNAELPRSPTAEARSMLPVRGSKTKKKKTATRPLIACSFLLLAVLSAFPCLYLVQQRQKHHDVSALDFINTTARDSRGVEALLMTKFKPCQEREEASWNEHFAVTSRILRSSVVPAALAQHLKVVEDHYGPSVPSTCLFTLAKQRVTAFDSFIPDGCVTLTNYTNLLQSSKTPRGLSVLLMQELQRVSTAMAVKTQRMDRLKIVCLAYMLGTVLYLVCGQEWIKKSKLSEEAFKQTQDWAATGDALLSDNITQLRSKAAWRGNMLGVVLSIPFLFLAVGSFAELPVWAPFAMPIALLPILTFSAYLLQPGPAEKLLEERVNTRIRSLGLAADTRGEERTDDKGNTGILSGRNLNYLDIELALTNWMTKNNTLPVSHFYEYYCQEEEKKIELQRQERQRQLLCQTSAGAQHQEQAYILPCTRGQLSRSGGLDRIE